MRLSIILLAYNEEKNLPDCLESLQGLAADIFVVDSGSTDRTKQIATAAGCKIYDHPFENYSAQRNWSFDHLPLKTDWVFPMDCDERFTPELVKSINEIVSHPNQNTLADAYIVRKKSVFLGKWIRFGGQYNNFHLRLAKKEKIRCESRSYHQHFVTQGIVGYLNGDLVDIIASNSSEWVSKISRWAKMEADSMIAEKTAVHETSVVRPHPFGNKLEQKRFLKKEIYQRLPLFIRPFLLWSYTYLFRMGFLDGREGLILFTIKNFYFPFLVDAELFERRKKQIGTSDDIKKADDPNLRKSG